MSTDEALLLPRFCERTGNPCGTDTVHNDEPGCSCRQCMLWCLEELKQRWLAMDLQRTENEKLRIALSDCANHAAGFRCTSGMCSTEFLLNVPEEVRLQIGARERDRDATRAALVRVEAERDAARAEAQAMENSYIAESSRNCEAERALRDALLDVLSSATPHPVEHPSMWRTWRQANKLLGRDPDTHVIPTADKDLEQYLMTERP